MASALGSLKRTWPDIAIILCLACLSLWVRRLTLLDIEAGGDAIRKWLFVKQWLYQGSFADLEWNHHLARFGINIWVFVVQLIWGTDPSAYYIAPVAAATAGVVFCYKLGQELGGRYAGLIGGVWFATMEPLERAGSQLLPAVFEAAYVAGAAYFLVWYLRFDGSLRWRRALLLLSSVFLFFAYLAKVSNLLFVPGFVLSVWLFGGRRRDALLWLGVFFGLWLVETAWYSLFTEYTHRFEIIKSSHHGGTVRNVTRTVHRAVSEASVASARETTPSAVKVVDWVAVVWKFLERYTVLWESIKFPLFVFLGSSLGLSVFAKSRPARAITLVVFVQLFLVTFSIRQLSPLKVWMSNEPRYMIVLCPLLVAMNAAFVVLAVREVSVSLRQRLKDTLWPRLARFQKYLLPLAGKLAPIWAILVCLFVAGHYHDINADRYLEGGYPLKHHERYQQRFSAAYQKGLPIVERRSRHKKALRLIYSVYLPTELIERDGKLPSFEDAVRPLDRHHDWLSRDAGAFLKDAQNKVRRERRCVYTTTIRGRYLRVTPNRSVPSSCTAKRSL